MIRLAVSGVLALTTALLVPPTGLEAQPAAPHRHGDLACCAIDDFDMLPEAVQRRIQERMAQAGWLESLTLLPAVEIDPLGADPDTPWTAFATVTVREAPFLGANAIGTLVEQTQVQGTYHVVEETDEEWISFTQGNRPAFVHRMGLTRPHPANVEKIGKHGDLPLGEEIVNRWWGIPISYEASDLVDLPLDYTNARGPGRLYQLRREAAESLIQMVDEARADGVFFYASSPYRSGPTQVSIYTRNIQRNPAQRSSAPPGHSEHQLGTTVDFSNAQPGGRFLRNTDPQWEWLDANAHRFGWRQTYRADNIGETGYIEEPWHWRFFGMPGADRTVVGWMMH